jgi:hypothetical protein
MNLFGNYYDLKYLFGTPQVSVQNKEYILWYARVKIIKNLKKNIILILF